MADDELQILKDCSTELRVLPETVTNLGNSVDLFGKYVTESCSSDGLGPLQLASNCLRAFVRANFTGPADNTLPSVSEDVEMEMRDEKLSFGLNRPEMVARNLEMLYMAKLLLLEQRDLVSTYDTADWWTMRLLIIWQRILTDPCSELKTLFEHYSDRFQSSDTFSKLPKHLQTEFYLESTNGLLSYYEYDGAFHSLELAMKSADLRVELVGKLGKRTRFQTRDIAQLLLEVNNGQRSSESCSNERKIELPFNQPLQDETLLESVELQDPSSPKPHLTAIQQACLLTLCRYEQKTQHKDELLAERVAVYIENVIARPICWSVQFSALMLRSKLEKQKSRKVERACSQMENLANLLESGRGSETSNGDVRWPLALAVNFSPFWQVRAMHADILLSLGIVGEALSIFEKLKMREKVVECYKRLNKLDTAEHVIRKLIEERPDPMYYCLLGDITANEEHYNTAWKISNNRFSRAQISLGRLYYQRGKLKEAYDAMERGLQLQSLNHNDWFTFGHIAWKLQLYQESARAYHRCLSIEPDNFEAWNNLSACYVRLQQKDRARKILQEALKYSYDDWKVWENYLLICIDTAEFLDAIKAYHRLLDLKDKHEDAQVLEILTAEALKDGTTSEALSSELVTLFGRITAKMASNGRVWRSYASLHRPSRPDDVEQNEKYIKLLQRAFQATIQEKDWEKKVDTCAQVMEDIYKLAERQLFLANLKQSTETRAQLKQSARMNLKRVTATVRRRYDMDMDGVSADSKLAELLGKLDQLISRTTSE